MARNARKSTVGTQPVGSAGLFSEGLVWEGSGVRWRAAEVRLASWCSVCGEISPKTALFVMSNSLVNADQNEVILFDRGGNGLVASTDLISTTSRVYPQLFEVLRLISVEMHWGGS